MSSSSAQNNGNLVEGLRWLDQAQADLKTAKDCHQAGNYYAAAFFCQQAAEKALKGFLYSKGFRALLTHSVLELLSESAKIQPSFGELLDLGRELDMHHLGSRYPNFYPSGAPYVYYTQQISARCISYAELILEEVRKSMRR